MELVATPDNPMPDGAEVRRVLTKDGIALRVARWMPAGVPKGTICILQGRAEFIEKYFEVTRELLDRGFSVVAFDWRGQGGSQRALADARKGHVGDFAFFVRDLDAIRLQVLEADCPKPHIALAHSMGGAVALQQARRGLLPFERLVTTAPMIALSHALLRNPGAARALSRFLTLIGWGPSWVPGGGETSISTKPFAGNPLTGDPVRYARNANAAAAIRDWAIGDPTLAWLNGAFSLMRRLAEPRAALEIRTPTLILAAGADAICATPAIERFASRLKSGGAIVLKGARHEIMMESDAIRAEFWAAFDAFVPGTHELPETAVENERTSPPSAAGEALQGGGVDARVSGSHDRAAV